VGIVACAATGCDEGSDTNTTGSGGAAGADSNPDLCPDPNDPGVHYLNPDPNDCDASELRSTSEQNGFHNGCGCGCIDEGGFGCPDPGNPDVRYFSRDRAECSGTPACELDELSFSNSCGCILH
jgi:hypothetical protein